MGLPLRLDSFQSQFDVKWQPQLTYISRHKNDHFSVIFTDIELKFDVEVAECHPLNITS